MPAERLTSPRSQAGDQARLQSGRWKSARGSLNRDSVEMTATRDTAKMHRIVAELFRELV